MTTMERRTIKVGSLPAWQKGGSRRRLEVEIELRPMQNLGNKLTTDHQPVSPDAVEVSICGTEWEGRRDVGGGQNIETFRELLSDPGSKLDLPRADIEWLIEVWERWHLNGMTALCSHQPEAWTCSNDGTVNGFKALEASGKGYPASGYNCLSCGRARWDEPTDHCPETGYKAATAWLAEEVPQEVVDRLLVWGLAKDEVSA